MVPVTAGESLDQLETGRFTDIILISSPSNTTRGVCQHAHSTDEDSEVLRLVLGHTPRNR